MAIKRRHVKAIIQIRRATENEWIEHDPILRLGEPALSIDVYALKVGDGQRRWSEIPYLMENEFEHILELIDQGHDELELYYATKEWVEENAGTVRSITVNGIPQTLDGNKNIDIQIQSSYQAGNGIVIDNGIIQLDDLILDCGTSTTGV